MRPDQLVHRVELPLATRKIMTGVRTSGVISIGVATLPALIGAGGLRDPIVTGFSAQRRRLDPHGAVLAALVASLLGRAEHRLTARWLA